MPKAHDRGGWPTKEPIDRTEHPVMDWECRTAALDDVISNKGLMRVDEWRRVIEDFAPGQYDSLSYYERWVSAIEALMLEKHILSKGEIDRKVAEIERKGG